MLAIAYLIFEWILRLAALFIVPRRRHPSAGAAWLLLIFLIPPVGWLLFAVLGNYKLPRRRMQVQSMINQQTDAQIAELERDLALRDLIEPSVSSVQQSTSTLARQLGKLPALSGNSLDIITDYDSVFAHMIDDIDRAEEYVYVQYYIASYDEATAPVFEALARAAERGVEVRFLYDAWGSRKYRGKRAMIEFLQANRISTQPMLALQWPGPHYVRPDLRNHRKIVVIDGEVGYTGSQNLIERSYERRDGISYDELVVRVSGPVSLEMTALVASDWMLETGEVIGADDDISQRTGQSIIQVLPSGPGFVHENNLQVFTHAIHQAEQSITIVNPYFVPPESLLSALISAAQRGVQVRMINSAAIDQWMVARAQRSYYDTLLAAGVEIYLYPAPKFLHSKFMAIDDTLAIVGSSNLDMRSFELTAELSLLVYDAGSIDQLATTARRYLDVADRLTDTAWQQRPRREKILENLARLTSALQ